MKNLSDLIKIEFLKLKFDKSLIKFILSSPYLITYILNYLQ